jgi:Flp pilus assembly pilin Flp
MKIRKAQSILEYTLLVVVVSAALMAMHKYINRALNARLKQVQLELNESIR